MKLPLIGKVKKLLITNKAVLIAVVLSLVIAIPTTLYLSEKNKNAQSVEQTIEKVATNGQTLTTPSGDSPVAVEPQPTASTSTPSRQTTTPQKTTTNSTTQSSNTTPQPSPPANPAPTQKPPYTFTFSSGNRTANWYAGGTFFPPSNGYTDEWVYITGKADSTGFLNWRLSYNCSSGSACPAILLQGSNDGVSWINYKTLSSATNTLTYPVLYPYYRLLLASGNCSSNACPPPTPPFPITYELSASGYFYYN